MRSRSMLLTNACTSVKCRRHLIAQLGQRAQLVEDEQVLRRVEQLLMFVLAVELDEPVGEVLERGRGGERAR